VAFAVVDELTHRVLGEYETRELAEAAMRSIREDDHLIRRHRLRIAGPDRPPLCDLMTTGDVAAYFGVSPRTVINWANQGRLRRIKLGHRTVYYERRDVQRFVEEATSPPRS
jgi:excisionase family DNA binding protein